MPDLILRNCQVVDGGGGAPFTSDIAIRGGKIAGVAQAIADTASSEIDVDGQYVAPGFIDIHRHSDAIVFRPDFGEIQLRQGITTTINGNCGLSIAPCPPKWREEILSFLKPVIGSVPSDIEFDSFSQYLEQVSRLRLPINFGMHIGNGTLRIASKGFALGKMTSEEVATAHSYLFDALSAGAFGVSMGLAYAPENNYDLDGVVEVLDSIRGIGVPLVTHIRGEGTLLPEALREVIAIAKRLEAPLHVSHFKCVGACNWGRLLRQAIDMIEAEQAAGMSITCDVYPWVAGSSLLAQILPPDYLEGGMAKATQRLKDAGQRERCKDILSRPQTDFENQALLLGWENIMVGSVKTEKNRECEGKRISEIAAMRGMDPADAALELLADEDCEVSMINFIACEEDIETILKLPYSFIISDSIYPDGGKPHPRQYGTFPKILAEYVRDRRILTLQEAVRKFTAAPAERFRIAGKGMIKEGYDADLVVFDLEAVRNGATYLNPRELGTGLSYVLVNGKIANDHDSFINTGAGKVLRRG